VLRRPRPHTSLYRWWPVAVAVVLAVASGMVVVRAMSTPQRARCFVQPSLQHREGQ
jgi:hypothetical protein